MSPGPVGIVAAAALALAAFAPPAADAGGRDRLPAATPPAYLQECGACHPPYPPAMLPIESWARLVAGLERHFGTDASLDAATLGRIAGWLQLEAGAARRVREAPPEDRITRSAWFGREHRRIGASTWTRPAVGSAANCGACHPGADRGLYDDDRVRVPDGPGPRATGGRHD